ncbi:DegT/DnrJ/EryC1/StrS family aminotransferase [Wenzhouxiangella sp. AB-CW3]|uniref:DegT/DnrJ/EryC1/StrS family aminotransferase n=1 Tax=Wenzhouxiangella sp. AB-CW3 TaxID=2771012 RepID=UPI00168BE4EB|nr:DegT/DnrJ/EryC1/StrS family aminotransferase [Wenzhouxiangella sp. AB-CW3]QOC23464.1 DegT/DnrJ/EryC1/StrS family aminotransferase [Wenzhouxiangella sp. AB-CW3]
MNPIPMVDLELQYRQLENEINPAIADVLAGTRFILGPNVTEFEQEAADYLGVKHALGCASGTDALHLALRAAGIGPGDEVITTPFTFIATAEAIAYCGATPVFVDIDARTFNVDPEAARAAITDRTRALLPVHLFGQPADMAALQVLAEEHGLLLIEDCAQSFGAAIDGRQTGSFGLAGCFSFFPSKNLGCYGDGGLITTSDDQLFETLWTLRNHGRKAGDYYHEMVGYNSRLDEIQAAILRVKLARIDQFNEQRRRVAQAYGRLLGDTELVMPYEDGIGRHVYHQFTMLVPEQRREALMQALRDESIASAVYYPTPLHQQPAFADLGVHDGLPVSEEVSKRCLSLPVFPEMTDEQIERVSDCLKRAL